MQKEIESFLDKEISLIWEKRERDPEKLHHNLKNLEVCKREALEKYPNFKRIVEKVFKKKEKRFIRKHKEILQRENFKYINEARHITDTHLFLSIINLIKTEVLKYLKKIDLEIYSNVASVEPRLKEAFKVAEKAEKNQLASWYGMKKAYETTRAYMLGVEKRIGHLADDKDRMAITKRATRAIDLKHREITQRNDTKPLNTKYLGDKDCFFYVTVGCALEIIEDFYKKPLDISKEDMKYIKTYISKTKKWYLDFEVYLKEHSEELTEQHNRLKKEKELKELLGDYYWMIEASLKMISPELNIIKGDKDLWWSYFEHLKTMSPKELRLEKFWLKGWLKEQEEV